MTRKIVGAITSYAAITQSDWLWQQTPHPFGTWGNIQMLARSPAPDFLLMYNFHDFPQPPENGTWWLKYQRQQIRYQQQIAAMPAKLRNVPRERTIFLWREPPLTEIVHKTIAFYQQAQPYCRYISGPDDYAPTPNYMPAIWYHNNSFRDLNEMPTPEKVKLCSWITSGISRTANHRQRLDFMQQLQENNINCDFYGRNLPTWVQSGGELSNKWYAMAPYYYNLAIENYAQNDWYVSEKLWDALLAWCLPIYYGGAAAERLLPPGSFLKLPSLDRKGLSYIQEVTATPDAWQAARNAIAEARQIILHKLNLLNWLSEFIAQYD